MAAAPVNINDLPYNDITIQVNNIKDLTGETIPQCSFYNLILLLENKLTYVCDMIIKLPLSVVYNPEYVIVGGKALNNIISKNNLQNSFNYDICVNNNNDIKTISTTILNNLIINNHWQKHYRSQIYNILLHSNLVDIPQVNDISTLGSILYYYMNDPLIYYGKRISNGNKQPGDLGIVTDGLFIKLVLKKELFSINGQPYICSNERLLDLTNYIITQSPLNPPLVTNLTKDYNIIYLPIANIINAEINFGVPNLIQNNLLYFNTFDRLKYAIYPLLVYNLIQNIIKDKLNNSGTYSKNINKLKLLINMAQYNCQFMGDIKQNIMKIQVDTLAVILNALINPVPPEPYYKTIPLNIDLNRLILFVNKSLIFTENTQLVEIIKNFLIAYERIYTQRKAICTTNLLLKHDDPNFNTHIANNNQDENTTYAQLVAQINDLDKIYGRRYIKEYTGVIFQLITPFSLKNGTLI